ncbi:MAG: hypothetical protein LBT53_02545 [Puniceicoccales bacterium]|jgi:uncharacterized protein YoxC|nr:hypothetical protein [Puniceicoccales bacterium]
MNKTVSLIVRLLAILAAIGSGVAWYVINTYNLEHAMKQSAWLENRSRLSALGVKSTDQKNEVTGLPVAPEYIGDKAVRPDHKDASPFTKRMDRLDGGTTGGAPKLIADLYARIDDLIGRKNTLDDIVAARDTTIKERDATIAGLEDDKRKLTTERNKLADDGRAKDATIASLTSEKAALQETVSERDKTIAAMFTKEAYDAEVNLRKEAEDKVDKTSRIYARLWNWGERETGVKPPYVKDPLDKNQVALDVPKPKEATPKVLTTIATVDYRKGLLTLFVGKDEKENALKAPQIYDVEVEGAVIGRIRVTEVLDSMTVATILADTNQRLLVKNAVVRLIRTQAKTEDKGSITSGLTTTTTAVPTTRVAAPPPPAPAPEAAASPFGAGAAAPLPPPEL